MSNRFMTDGAGQEVCAQMDKVIARFNGTTPPEVTPGTYDSKDFLSEETGRALAGKVSDLADAVGAFIENNGNDISNAVVTLGASLTYNGSAQTQTVASVKLGSVTLRAGTDYDISGNVATNAGNYTLIVSGKGDYSGFVFVDWSIAKAQGSISAPSSVNIVGIVGLKKEITFSANGNEGSVVAISANPNVVTSGVVGNTIVFELVSTGDTSITLKFADNANYIASTQISVSAKAAASTLNDNSWEVIKAIADQDLGESVWSIGDTKSITLNGEMGEVDFNNETYWVYIIGFNHNADLEGDHLIHFAGFKTAQENGKDMAITGGGYGSQFINNRYLAINHWGSATYGGWAACDARYDILGSTDVPPQNYGSEHQEGDVGYDPTENCTSSPVQKTLMASLPADLRAVMHYAVKYTDNFGNLDRRPDLSHVTGTKDYLPLLGAVEIWGEFQSEEAGTAQQWEKINPAENVYQKRYAYFLHGNSSIKYKRASLTVAAEYYCRSVGPSNSTDQWRTCEPDGGIGSSYPSYDYGFAPIFFV